MKQIVTIFRAEEEQAKRMLRQCRMTRKADLPVLRDTWRSEAQNGSTLSAYVEYLDGWLMGDDFTRIMGSDARCRAMPSGELRFLPIAPKVLLHLAKQARRKHQFPEQAEFARVLARLSTSSVHRDVRAVAIAVFRSVGENKTGSNHGVHDRLASSPP